MVRVGIPSCKIVHQHRRVHFYLLLWCNGLPRKGGPFIEGIAMNILKYATMVASLCLAGCLGTHSGKDTFRGQVNVFGIALYSSIDYQEIEGVRATDEPCLKGYERSFEPLEITIGYGFDKKIRKITTRNLKTNLFGITPGMSVEEGRVLTQQAGLTDILSPFKFKGETITLTLLVDAHGKVFGITVEVND